MTLRKYLKDELYYAVNNEDDMRDEGDEKRANYWQGRKEMAEEALNLMESGDYQPKLKEYLKEQIAEIDNALWARTAKWKDKEFYYGKKYAYKGILDELDGFSHDITLREIADFCKAHSCPDCPLHEAFEEAPCNWSVDLIEKAVRR